MKTNFKSLYTAFDPYPSFKGSSIHIEKVTTVLSSKFPETMLLTLPEHTERGLGNNISHYSFPVEESNYLRRANIFSDWVRKMIHDQSMLQVGHFRDIWGGLPILEQEHITSIFEVNGLPSIELSNRYPLLAKDTINKIIKLEDHCLQKANLIICPSQTIRKHLVNRQVLENKIHVISNGADIPEHYTKPADLPDEYIVYFGALQPWQGVDVLLKAMQYLRDKTQLKLIICSSHKEKFSRPYLKLASKLEIEDQVVWKHKLGKQELFRVIQHAVCTVAPLTECSRNLEQGCSPLKIFESMACRTPIIAADLPVVHEIVEPEKEAKLFRPERPAELARCIRLLVDYPELGKQMADAAYKKITSKFTWDKIDQQLSHFYDKLVRLVYA